MSKTLIAEMIEALKELRDYANLKLKQHRCDYDDDHAMVQTAIRMVALADNILNKVRT